jgi:hypothetical protein
MQPVKEHKSVLGKLFVRNWDIIPKRTRGMLFVCKFSIFFSQFVCFQDSHMMISSVVTFFSNTTFINVQFYLTVYKPCLLMYKYYLLSYYPFTLCIYLIGGTRWRSWLRHSVTSRKVAGWIPNGVTGIFHWHNPSGRTVALGLTQSPTEMGTRSISWV